MIPCNDLVERKCHHTDAMIYQIKHSAHIFQTPKERREGLLCKCSILDFAYSPWRDLPTTVIERTHTGIFVGGGINAYGKSRWKY